MSEEREYAPESGECRLEAQYNPTLHEVGIYGNDAALRRLRDIISWLIDEGKPGSHEHLDRVSGLEGNVSSLVIGKKGE